MCRRFLALLAGLCFSILSIGPAAADTPLVVHEWGTITSWHQPDGTPVGRLNRIEPSEVLPSFVHSFEPPKTQEQPERSLRKTPLTPGRPDVTMRLETPVVYFYPGPDYDAAEPFAVEVSLRGGVINEFFPAASASVAVDMDRIAKKTQAGIIREWNGDVLDNYVRGTIIWSVAALPAQGAIPRTEDPVWLAPRRVDSSHVAVASGETEKYLFYRGVAHLEAMLGTRSSGSEVTLLAPDRLHWLPDVSTVIPKAWIVAINDGGEVAFRSVEAIELRRDAPSVTLRSFASSAIDPFQSENLAELKHSMKQALLAEGLFPAEADAMLATWQRSYFEKPGRRIFYVVPSDWLDYHLPLKISVPHTLSRAFIGRIDLLDANEGSRDGATEAQPR